MDNCETPTAKQISAAQKLTLTVEEFESMMSEFEEAGVWMANQIRLKKSQSPIRQKSVESGELSNP